MGSSVNPEIQGGNMFGMQALNMTTGVPLPGWQRIHKFGQTEEVGVDYGAVWTAGGIYPWPTAAETVRIKAGGNANDILGGTGAGRVRVQGLDENWLEAVEEIEAAGASASAPTAIRFVRIFRAHVFGMGTYGGVNAGQIDIENTVSRDVIAIIGAGDSQSLMALYSIPANKQGFFLRAGASFKSTKETALRILIREDANIVTGEMGAQRTQHLSTANTGYHEFKPATPGALMAYQDIWFEVKVLTGPACAAVEFDMIFKDI